MNKKVFIIGSLSQMIDIEFAAQRWRQKGYQVDHAKPQPDKSFEDILDQTIKKLYKADIVEVVKKPNGALGTGCMYELAIAKFFHKDIHFYNKEEKINERN